MHVALLTYSTRPRGGVVHTLALAEALARRDDTEVTVVTLGRGGDRAFFRDVDPAVDIDVVPFDERPGEAVGARILRSIDTLGAHLQAIAGRFDVVHAQDCISANAAGPCVRTVHHIDRFRTPELVRCHERAIRLPHTHICVSRTVADELAAGWGIEATVIPNGVDAARFAAAAADTPSARAARERWRAQLGGPVVLSVGGIEPRKGSLELVEAVARVRHAVPQLRWVVAGGETLFDHRAYRVEVDRRAAELGVEPVVLGTVEDTRLPSLMAAADVIAFPSTYEGFGLVPLEALAAGTPLVVRDVPVLREVVGDAARYGHDPASLAAALQAALGPRDAARVAAGRAVARSYRWDAAAHAHRRLYARRGELVSGGGGCSPRPGRRPPAR